MRLLSIANLLIMARKYFRHVDIIDMIVPNCKENVYCEFTHDSLYTCTLYNALLCQDE